MEARFTRLFKLAHEALKDEKDPVGRPLATYSGATATAALVDHKLGQVTVSHVGDSTMILVLNGEVLFRTRDHVVDEEAAERVKKAGGEVHEFTISGMTSRRVCAVGSRFPGLAMARALGDLAAQDLGVIHEPEVTVAPLPEGAALILASDGVWEHVPVEEAAALTAKQPLDAQVLAWTLVEKSRERWPAEGNIDDITALVFFPPAPEASTPGPMRSESVPLVNDA